MFSPITFLVMAVIAAINAYAYAEWHEPINLGTTVLATLTFFFLLHEDTR